MQRAYHVSTLATSLLYEEVIKKKGVDTVDKMYIGAKEIATMLDISEGLSYKLIRKMNAELKERGYITIQGRVSRKYSQEKFYGANVNEQ